MDTKSFAIGTLSVTAVILLAALVILGQLPDPQPALGSGVAMAGGDYMILTGYYERNAELVYIIDTATKRLNVYGYDKTRGKGRGGLAILQSVDLTKLLPGPPAQRGP
jgi:hypothetical protein